jgi:hypothetical protein
MIKIRILTLFIFFLCGCKTHIDSTELYLPEDMKVSVLSQANFQKILIYYHSGDCSFCYGILALISKEYPNTCIVSVSNLPDTKLIDFYLNEINFQGISLVDSSAIFLKSNKKLLDSYNLFLVDRKFTIIAEGIGLDQRTKKEIETQLYR